MNANGLLFNSGNVLTNLASANSGVLVTSAGGVPSISTTLPAVNGAALTNLAAGNTNYVAGGTSPATQTVQTKLRQYVNALDYSGVDKTGTTDSVTGLTNALAAAVAQGTCLYIPSGISILPEAGFSGRRPVAERPGHQHYSNPIHEHD